jgi:hypothetical protein
MNENENITTEVSQPDNDTSFEAGWGDDTAVNSPEEDDTLEAEETEAEEAEGQPTDQTESTDGETEEPQKAEETSGEIKGDTADQQFTLKHLDDVKTVGREEVISLAQKGMDYDRQREKYDTLTQSLSEMGGIETINDHEAFIKELAENSGVNVDTFIDRTRASILAKKENIDPSIANERIKLQKQEKTLNARENQLNEAEKQKNKADEEKEKRESDFLAFVKTYPDVKATDIPSDVWKEVGKGATLMDAYGKYEASQLKAENQRLQSELSALRQNDENRKKAAGSQKTAGNKSTKADPFDEGWDD